MSWRNCHLSWQLRTGKSSVMTTPGQEFGLSWQKNRPVMTIFCHDRAKILSSHCHDTLSTDGWCNGYDADCQINGGNINKDNAQRQWVYLFLCMSISCFNWSPFSRFSFYMCVAVAFNVAGIGRSGPLPPLSAPLLPLSSQHCRAPLPSPTPFCPLPEDQRHLTFKKLPNQSDLVTGAVAVLCCRCAVAVLSLCCCCAVAVLLLRCRCAVAVAVL